MAERCIGTVGHIIRTEKGWKEVCVKLEEVGQIQSPFDIQMKNGIIAIATDVIPYTFQVYKFENGKLVKLAEGKRKERHAWSVSIGNRFVASVTNDVRSRVFLFDLREYLLKVFDIGEGFRVVGTHGNKILLCSLKKCKEFIITENKLEEQFEISLNVEDDLGRIFYIERLGWLIPSPHRSTTIVNDNGEIEGKLSDLVVDVKNDKILMISYDSFSLAEVKDGEVNPIIGKYVYRTIYDGTINNINGKIIVSLVADESIIFINTEDKYPIYTNPFGHRARIQGRIAGEKDIVIVTPFLRSGRLFKLRYIEIPRW